MNLIETTSDTAALQACAPRPAAPSAYVRRISRILSALAAMTIGLMVGAQAQTYNDGHGREWRQLIDNAGISWTQLASACPRDGLSACRSVGGWVWATDAQVLQLFSYSVPTMPPSRAVSGLQYFEAAQTFPFRPTFSSCQTYSCGNFWGGWTASQDDTGLPIFGSVGWHIGGVEVASASFGVGPSANPDQVSNWMGAWMFRVTSPGVHAYDDGGIVASPAGGTAVANVLANDWNGGVRATLGNVILAQSSSSNPGIALNVATGSVDAAPGTPAGGYQLVYMICDAANTTDCATATVSVVVRPYAIVAANDVGAASPATGGVAISSVLTNDTLGGASAAGKVSLRLLSAPLGGITLDTASGAVNVAAGTALGTSSVSYEICELANPGNCARATATVTVRQNPIRANDDSFSGSSKIGGIIGNVLANDTFNGTSATSAAVNLSVVSLIPANPDVALELGSGAIRVNPKATSGTFALAYRLCEIASPSNCSNATATINLSGRSK